MLHARSLLLLLLLSLLASPCLAQDHLYDVTFLDRKHGYAVGWGTSPGGVIRKTTDAGKTWSETIPVQGAFLFSVRFTSAARGYAAGYDPSGKCGLVLSTKNAGKSWKKTLLPETFGLYDIEFPTAKLGFVCGYDGGIFRTTNGGKSWTKLDTGAGKRVFRWMTFADTRHGFAACGTAFSNSNHLYRTTDGGRRWKKVHDLGDGNVFTGLHALDPQTLVASAFLGSKGALLKSTDGGSTWETKYDAGGQAQGLTVAGDIVCAVGAEGFAALSTDRGDTWNVLETGYQGTALAAAIGGDSLVAVGEGGLVSALDLKDR